MSRAITSPLTIAPASIVTAPASQVTMPSMRPSIVRSSSELTSPVTTTVRPNVLMSRDCRTTAA
jgi:hypothetical protein